MNLARFLFRAARTAADVQAVSSGDPERITRRAKNKAIVRLLGRLGLWGRLWR